MTNQEIRERYGKRLSENQMATLRNLRNRRRKHKLGELENQLINTLQSIGRGETPVVGTTVCEENTTDNQEKENAS